MNNLTQLCHSYGINYYLKILFLVLIVNSSNFTFSQQLAFPTAEGFGKFASGGRGGITLKVTNLNDSGPGSLRQALQYSSGARTIIFEVGGIIDLNSVLNVAHGNVTVAGQTAPGDGILIKGGTLIIESSNVIIRHIRFRSGKTDSGQQDALAITAWDSDTVENIIIDHCSISWGEDENFNSRAPNSGIVKNITIQNSIISESGYGVLNMQRTFNLTYYKNLFAHNKERNIASNYPTDKTFSFEMINNLIYGFRWATSPALGTKFSVVNNYYKKSSQTEIMGAAVDGTRAGEGTSSETYAYIVGNVTPSGMDEYSSILSPYIKTTPYANSGINALTANQVPQDILSHVGASLPKRDAVDVRLIKQYNMGNGVLASSGTYPNISGGTALVDSDNDGMPDTWELANGLDPNDETDRNIVQPDGYTNLEYYLNGMTLKVEGVTANAGTDVFICEGNNTKLTATGGSSYLWSTGETTASITVKPEATTTYTVTAYDSSGNNSDTDDVVVTVNPLPTVSAGPDVNLNVGEAITLTASGADSYLWSTGATTASIEVSPNSTTTYTVTGTTNNCEASDAVTVFSVEASVNANAGEDTIICQGSTATLTATGGTSYLWNTGATTASIEVSPSETTTYTVTAYDATGDKSDTDEVLVAVNPLPTVDAGKDVTINSGESVVLTATGTEFFKWDTGATEASITVSPTATKTYTVTGTTNGCEVTDTIIVTVLNKSEITANAGKDQTICEGASATLTATGGTSYLWNTGATTASIEVSPIETTTYSVTAYDAKGDKSDTDEVLVTVNPLPTVDAGKDVTINSGENITLTAIGTKTFKWDTGATEASITVSPSATKTYTVTGTTNGCEVTDTVTVTVLNSTQTTADAGMDQTICEGASVTLTATGGDSFLWNTGATTPTIKVSPSQTTTYTVTVSDTSGNTSDTDDVVVTVNPLPTVDAGKNKVIKIGESITLTATGAQSYIWNTGATEASITVSPSTTTTYTVIGSTNGCDATDTITVRVQGSNEVVVDAGKDQSICEGGSVILTATGGETYLWNTGITTASIEVSPSETTTYTVTAYDSKGNPSDSDDVIVTVNPIPIVDAGKDVTINLGESVVLSATGSNNYQWSTGVSGPSINVSPTSTQTYTVTGTSNTCEATDSVTVTVLNTDTTAVKANAGLDQIICYGTSTTLTATGGDTYLWNTGETTSSINVSPTATTKFTVTAYKGDVSSTDEVVVYVDAKPNVTITNGAEAAILEGEFITLSATGADSYLWSNGATEPNIAVSPRATKTYSVTGTINNCEAQKSVVVNVFEKVVANAGSDVTLCRNEKTVLTADGPKNSSYLWSTGETTKSITVEPKSDTEYSVMVYHELDSDTDNVMVKVVNCNSPQGSGQSGQLVQTLEPSRELNDGLTELEFVVYPNPTYGDVNIKISGLTNLSSIHLYDLSGKALYNETINDGEIQSYSKTLDLSQYTSGIYLLQLVDDNRVVTKKIILK